jgi:cytochrome c peroxidase
MRIAIWTVALVAVTAGLLAAPFARSAAGPTTAALKADNPIRPVVQAPFGMEEFFAEARTVPSPPRARLGRWLFYDRRLSADGTIACATCHRPEHGFSETRAASIGIGGKLGRRKAPSLLNLAARTTLVSTPERDLGEHFFWDGRADSLEEQVVAPMENPVEMGSSHRAVVGRIASIEGYRPFFAESFGTTDVTLERVAAALADYVRTLRSGNAPYDRWRYRRDQAAVSSSARRGHDIFFFKGRCSMCHAGFNFSDGRFHNLGVGWNPVSSSFSDEGRAEVTGLDQDRGAFKTPALRDVAKRAPYMHDGSLATLRDVVEFYNRGGNRNPWSSRRLAPLGLSRRDVDDLVAFLHTLSGDRQAGNPPSLIPK